MTQSRFNTRAVSDNQKREVVERLLAAWVKKPDQRLGQLIDNAMYTLPDVDIFYVEDFTMIEAIEEFVK